MITRKQFAAISAVSLALWTAIIMAWQASWRITLAVLAALVAFAMLPSGNGNGGSGRRV